MNKRIQKLAEQAGYSKDFLAIGLPNNMEKFAELIVRECADFLSQGGGVGHEDGNRLKRHFGVDE